MARIQQQDFDQRRADPVQGKEDRAPGEVQRQLQAPGQPPPPTDFSPVICHTRQAATAIKT